MCMCVGGWGAQQLSWPLSLSQFQRAHCGRGLMHTSASGNCPSCPCAQSMYGCGMADMHTHTHTHMHTHTHSHAHSHAHTHTHTRTCTHTHMHTHTRTHTHTHSHTHTHTHTRTHAHTHVRTLCTLPLTPAHS